MSIHEANAGAAAGVIDAIRSAVEAAVPGATVEVSGGGGHYSIAVVSRAFEGLGMVESHRMVLSAIAHLMQGDHAPVHAVDSLRTRVA
jgi:acid stress-induced BolA-like protein IbaG/YrbA